MKWKLGAPELLDEVENHSFLIDVPSTNLRDVFSLPRHNHGYLVVCKPTQDEFGCVGSPEIVEVSTDVVLVEFGFVAALEAVSGPGETTAVLADVPLSISSGYLS